MKHRMLMIGLLWALSTNVLLGLELGSLSGTIQESSGRPAVGISVAIRSVSSVLPLERKAVSDLKGRFEFMSLFPGAYTLEVFSADPWDMISKSLIISPGKNDSLVIHLSDIVTMTFKPRRETGDSKEVLEDSKWVLRTSRATRPILRLCEAPDTVALAGNSGPDETFSPFPFKGVFDISSTGDSPYGGPWSDPFSSSFALARVLSPKTQLLVAAGLGLLPGSNQTSVRSALNYKVNDRQTATLALGFRQYEQSLLSNSDPAHALASFAQGNSSLARIQNLLITLDLQDRYKVNDHLELMGGATFDHVESVRSQNIVRPRVGLTATFGPDTTMHMLAASTTTELAKTFVLPDGSTITLPSMARMTLSPDSAQAESVHHYEVSVEQALGKAARLTVGVYQDQFRDRTLFLTNWNVVNAGRSNQRGYHATLRVQPLPKMAVAASYSYASGLEEIGTPLELLLQQHEAQQVLRTRYFHVLTGSVDYRVPKMHMQVEAVYRKILGSPLTLLDPFQTSSFAPEAGLNILITQPLPNFTALPGQLQAQADFRNVFGEGLCPSNSALPVDFLSQQTRVIRGGLSLKF
ncbi:MAG: TonB-dependent receptor [Acidobacteriia bacterium]|nr:TonB-dependent receptor [Terriglobia bacterium]